VANAVRHAGASRILIAARGAGDRTLLHVVDDGRGMSEEELERVLRPYAKGEESDGTGLGLHLVNELCAAEGIGLSLRSRPGRGLCVTLSIPRG
jgi:signal transduction histidine kinase